MSSHSRTFAAKPGDSSSLSTLSCNRCRKTLTATVFLCSCDCIFCEACTYEHFNASPQCPSCRKTLNANDFLELCIAESSAAPSEHSKNTFQLMLTKIQKNSSTSGVTHKELCTRLLHTLETDKRAVRFLMKQFVLDSSTQESKSGNIGRAYEQLKEDFTQLQQKSSTQRVQHEQSLSDLERKNQALATSMHDQGKKLQDALTQLEQLRQYHATAGITRLPSSSHSHSSGSASKRHASDRHNTSSQHPPMKSFMMQKQAREHAAQQERRQGRLPHLPGSITPMQVPPSSHHHNHHHHHHQASMPHAISAPPTPRIRDLSSGYVFTGSSLRSNGNGSYGGSNSLHYRGSGSNGHGGHPTTSSYSYSRR